MKHLTYENLYKAHLGDIDEKSLTDSKSQEQDIFIHNLIDLIVEKKPAHVDWDTKPFTSDFLLGSSSSPRQRLDETFFAFVLRLAAIVKEESYVRAFKKPESHHVLMAWIYVLRSVIFLGLGLLYDVKWTPESIFTHLEPAMQRLFSEGDAFALRRLMNDLGVKPVRDEPYPSELAFPSLNFLQTHQFGSFFWRFLHWMAEADALKKDSPASSFYRTQWREMLSKGPFYRALRCIVCMSHFEKMLKEADLLSESSDLPTLFFKMHNETHAYRRSAYKFLQEPDYTEDAYKKDAEFMRQALLFQQP